MPVYKYQKLLESVRQIWLNVCQSQNQENPKYFVFDYIDVSTGCKEITDYLWHEQLVSKCSDHGILFAFPSLPSAQILFPTKCWKIFPKNDKLTVSHYAFVDGYTHDGYEYGDGFTFSFNLENCLLKEVNRFIHKYSYILSEECDDKSLDSMNSGFENTFLVAKADLFTPVIFLVSGVDFTDAWKAMQSRLEEITGSKEFKLCGHPVFLAHIPDDRLDEWLTETVPEGFEAAQLKEARIQRDRQSVEQNRDNTNKFNMSKWSLQINHGQPRSL